MINIKDYITFRLGLDVIKYEEKMKKYWYKEDKSLKDFTRERFWETANILINKLL